MGVADLRIDQETLEFFSLIVELDSVRLVCSVHLRLICSPTSHYLLAQRLHVCSQQDNINEYETNNFEV